MYNSYSDKQSLNYAKLKNPKAMQKREENMADGPYSSKSARGLFHLGQDARVGALEIELVGGGKHRARGVRPSDRGAGVAAGALAGPPSRLTRTRTHSVSDDRVHVRGSAVVRAGPLLGVFGGARLRQTHKEPLSQSEKKLSKRTDRHSRR